MALESDTQCGREGKPGKEFCLQNDPGCAGAPTLGRTAVVLLFIAALCNKQQHKHSAHYTVYDYFT